MLGVSVGCERWDAAAHVPAKVPIVVSEPYMLSQHLLPTT